MPPEQAAEENNKNLLLGPAGMQALDLGSANQMHLSGTLNLKLMTQEQGQWTLHPGVGGSSFWLAGTMTSVLSTLGSSAECQGRQQCRLAPVSSGSGVFCTLAPWQFLCITCLYSCVFPELTCELSTKHCFTKLTDKLVERSNFVR